MMKEPITIELLNFVNATNGISSRVRKTGASFSNVRKLYQIESKTLSREGAKSANRKVKRIRLPLLILIKRKKIVKTYQKALSFGIKPRIIPRQTACAISPGCELLFSDFKNLRIFLNIKILLFLYLSYGSLV